MSPHAMDASAHGCPTALQSLIRTTPSTRYALPAQGVVVHAQLVQLQTFPHQLLPCPDDGTHLCSHPRLLQGPHTHHAHTRLGSQW